MRLLKFDLIYPPEYLSELVNENYEQLGKLTFDQYYQWIINNRIGLTDSITYHLNSLGWESREFYYQDNFFIWKLRDAFKLKIRFRDFFNSEHISFWSDFSLKFLIQSFTNRSIRLEFIKKTYLHRFIEQYKPDIIFLREPCQIDNQFWRRYKNKCLIVTMIGCNVGDAINWTLHNSDVIFTIMDEQEKFFNLNNVPTYKFEYGFDHRILDTIIKRPKQFDITFIGLLGTPSMQIKTDICEEIAKIYDFKWWGIKGNMINVKEYPNLARTWQGIVSGMELYQIYADSKIVFNDYGNIATGQGVNIRIKEALGVGSLLLTRDSYTLTNLKEHNAIATYKDTKECLGIIDFYLKNEKEREEIARIGQTFILKNYSYFNITKNISEKISVHFDKKFN